jgi:ubiquinone/menaquinone biosynthesis C-methylase UbiE
MGVNDLKEVLASFGVSLADPQIAQICENPAAQGLTPESLAGLPEEQRLKFVLGEYFANLAEDAGRIASRLLFSAQWEYKTPDWFDHRHHFLDPENHSKDFWAFSATNILKCMPLGGTLLNLCCGDGFYDHHFFSKRAASILALDINPAAIAVAKRKHRAPNIEYRLANVLELEVPPESYDTVCIRGAIEHFNEEHQQLIFRKALNALKPGGYFCGDTVANKDTDSVILEAHEHEWQDESEMLRDLKKTFTNIETASFVSADRVTLLWSCKK